MNLGWTLEFSHPEQSCSTSTETLKHPLSAQCTAAPAWCEWELLSGRLAGWAPCQPARGRQECFFSCKTVAIQHYKTLVKHRHTLRVCAPESTSSSPAARAVPRETYFGRALVQVRSFDLKKPVLNNLLANHGHYSPNHPSYKKATALSPGQYSSWLKWQPGKPLFPHGRSCKTWGPLIASAEPHLLMQNTGPWRSHSSVLGKNICKSDILRQHLNVLWSLPSRPALLRGQSLKPCPQQLRRHKLMSVSFCRLNCSGQWWMQRLPTWQNSYFPALLFISHHSV